MKKPGKQKAIVLAEWNWTGHHPCYYRAFLSILGELGYKVLALCPDSDEAVRIVLEIGDFHNCFGEIEVEQIAMSSGEYRKRRKGGLRSIFASIQFFRAVEAQVARWAKRKGYVVSGIFFCCVYDWEFIHHRFVSKFLAMQWAGLYLHARSYRIPERKSPITGAIPKPRSIFRERLCKAVAILDEGIRDTVANDLDKPVIVFPDITDCRVADDEKSIRIADDLERFASGRAIIGLFGHLGIGKGIECFLEGARRAELSEYCFVLMGEVGWSQEEGEKIERAIYDCPNLWAHCKRVSDPFLNLILSKCDLLHAVYLDFPHSSNIVTKASVFKVPVLVSDGYLLAERVKKYNLGEVVRENDVTEFVGGVLKILAASPDWETTTQPQWAEYASEHSISTLRHKLAKLCDNF